MKKVKGISRLSTLIMSVSAVGCLIVYNVFMPNAYEVYLNGKVVACVTNISTGESIAAEVLSEVNGRFKGININSEMIYSDVIANKEAISSEDSIKDNILKAINTKVKAVEMIVDGERAAILANIAEGNTIIGKVNSYYSNKAKSENKKYTVITSSVKYNPIEVYVSQVDSLEKTADTLISNMEKGSGVRLKLSIDSDGSMKKTANGAKAMAMAVPSRGSISSNYGMRWGRMHEGIDIAGNTGEPIYAAVSGKVVFSGWMNGYGKVIKIEHTNNIETIYGHCSKLRVSVGDQVKKGQHIADIGSTGNSTGPHLHFEVLIDGKPVNPYSYIYKK